MSELYCMRHNATYFTEVTLTLSTAFYWHRCPRPGLMATSQNNHTHLHRQTHGHAYKFAHQYNCKQSATPLFTLALSTKKLHIATSDYILRSPLASNGKWSQQTVSVCVKKWSEVTNRCLRQTTDRENDCRYGKIIGFRIVSSYICSSKVAFFWGTARSLPCLHLFWWLTVHHRETK